MKRMLVTVALLGALLTGASAPAAPPGAIAGAGAGSPGGGLCGGTVAVVVSGVNLQGNTWLISGTAIVDPTGPCTILVAHVTGTGNWNPNSGGCVGGAIGSVCVDAVPGSVSASVGVDVCPAILGGCVSGSATVFRA
jgi:hypothetical protein